MQATNIPTVMKLSIWANYRSEITVLVYIRLNYSLRLNDALQFYHQSAIEDTTNRSYERALLNLANAHVFFPDNFVNEQADMVGRQG